MKSKENGWLYVLCMGIILCLAVFVIQMVGSARNVTLTTEEIKTLRGNAFPETQVREGYAPLASFILAYIVGDVEYGDGERTKGREKTERAGGDQSTGEQFGDESNDLLIEDIRRVRLGMMGITLLFVGYLGYATWWHTRRPEVVLLVLFWASFSPTLIASGRLFTLDVLTAFGMFLSVDWFARGVQTGKWVHWLGWSITTAVALLLHWSAFALIFIYTVLVLIWGMGVTPVDISWNRILVKGGVIILLIILTVGIYIGFFDQSVPWIRYIQPMLYPAEQSVYVFGNSYGEDVWWLYPVTYGLKTPLAFLVAMGVSVWFGGMSLWAARKQVSMGYVRECARNYSWELVLGGVVVGYALWLGLVRGYEGMPALLPLIPLLWILVSEAMCSLRLWNNVPAVIWILLIGGYISSALVNAPFYISYANGLTGKTYRYQAFAKENMDQGQDLKRLAQWTREKNIDTIHLDYFGAISPKTYFEKDAYTALSVTDGPQKGYVAVSVTKLHQMKEIGEHTDKHDGYWWLYWRTPDAQIGHSILIYNVTRW